jgi:hypothetical protein
MHYMSVLAATQAAKLASRYRADTESPVVLGWLCTEQHMKSSTDEGNIELRDSVSSERVKELSLHGVVFV